MNPPFARVGIALRVFCVAALVAIFGLMTVRVANRFFPLGSMGWSDEIIELLQVWLVFAGAAEVWRMGLHFRVELLPQALAGTRAGKVLDFALLACSLVFLAVFTWESAKLTLEMTDFSAIFAWPRKIWYAVMPLSGAFMIACTLAQLGQPKEAHESGKDV